jgi:hypothetical protein
MDENEKLNNTPVFKYKFHWDESDEVLHKTLEQPTEDLILERNANLRNNPDAIKSIGSGTETLGRVVANIPFIHLDWAVRNGYDIYSRDNDIAEKELHRFLMSPIGRLSWVRDNALF